MRAINHSLTGALIGMTIGEPVVALPVALLSHFVCDVIPHYGSGRGGNMELRSERFRNSLYIDTVLCLALVAVLFAFQPAHWLLATVCAFIASAPDLLSINRYRLALANKPWKGNVITRFANRIQWFERPIGAVVEVAWLAGSLALLSAYIH